MATRSNTIIKNILICFFSSILIMLFFYFTVDKKTDKKNGFRRFFNSTVVTLNKQVDLENPGYYIAGFTDNHIYLGTYQTPIHLIECTKSLSGTHHITLHINNNTPFFWKLARLSVDSPHVYITDGIKPTILYGYLNTLSLKAGKDPVCYFTHALNISPYSFIIRSVDSDSNQNILSKIQVDSPYIRKSYGLLKKQVDGLFCTDGKLFYDKEAQRTLYLYFYRNQFICMDTNLNVIYKGKTIDTNVYAKIKTATVTSKKIIFSAPPFSVNKNGCVHNGRLYVLSDLLADNEDPNILTKFEVIDTYSITDGQYLFSFYISKLRNQPIRNFQVMIDCIIVLYDHELCTYNLKFPNDSRFTKY